jgi:hypothetical protein
MPDFKVGRTTIPSAKPTAITTFSAEWAEGIQVKALPTNTGTIYVGGTDVTTSSFPLAPGEGLYVPTNSVRDVCALASVDGDILAWIIV